MLTFSPFVLDMKVTVNLITIIYWLIYDYKRVYVDEIITLHFDSFI